MTISMDQCMENACVLAEFKGMSLSMEPSGILCPVNSSDFFGHALHVIKNINGEENSKVLGLINEVVVGICDMYFQSENVEVCYQNTKEFVMEILTRIAEYFENHSLEGYEITADINKNMFKILEKILELDPECVDPK